MMLGKNPGVPKWALDVPFKRFPWEDACARVVGYMKARAAIFCHSSPLTIAVFVHVYFLCINKQIVIH